MHTSKIVHPTKAIYFMQAHCGVEPVFEATDDYLKTVVKVGSAPVNFIDKQDMPLKNAINRDNAPEKAPENVFQGQLLALIRENPNITYDKLARETRRDRKTVRRHLNALKENGFLRRIGSPKGGHWEVIES